MSNDPDEDLIEATIRRVAEAKAAREAAAGGDGQEVAPPMPADDAPQDEIEPDPEPAAAEPVEREAPAAAKAAAADEDVIEATIRRVAAARAAQEAEAVPRPPEPAIELPVAESHAPVLRPVAAPMTSPQPEPAATDGRFAAELHALRQEFGAMQGMLRELQARVDAALAVAGAGVRPGQQAVDDEEWDDGPTMPRIPLGQPVRPAIFRDPSPHTATAEHLVESQREEAVIDTRPIPQPLPPLHAEPKRGLDLLPRTYRLTVEDKRRGVDLVPLHRALLGMDGVRDMSLLSYSNGVAIISVEMMHELAPEILEQAVARAMSRGAKVEVHNDTTMVVKLAEE